MSIDPRLRALLDGPNFAALTTLGRDGAPSTHIMWVGADDEHVLINTEVHRQKYKNMKRDHRVALAVIDRASAYQFVEVRGRVVGEVRGDGARAHIDELARKYTGHDYRSSAITSERVIMKVVAERVYFRL